MKLGIELDGVLADVEGSVDHVERLYYGDSATPEERAALTAIVPGFWRRRVRVVPGAMGELLRIKDVEPRLEVLVISGRAERDFQATKDWLRTWFPDHLPWDLYATRDFSLVPAQVFVVRDKSTHPELADRPRVVESFSELGYGHQGKLPL